MSDETNQAEVTSAATASASTPNPEKLAHDERVVKYAGFLELRKRLEALATELGIPSKMDSVVLHDHARQIHRDVASAIKQVTDFLGDNPNETHRRIMQDNAIRSVMDVSAKVREAKSMHLVGVTDPRVIKKLLESSDLPLIVCRLREFADALDRYAMVSERAR